MTVDAGRVALVTGASRGIGRAIACRLAADGAAVAINHLGDAERADEVVAEIEAGGGRAIEVDRDVGDPEQVATLASTVERELGPPLILVNNAGIFPWTPWEEIEVAEWDRVFAVNVRGGFLAARACFRAMRDAGWGRVVSISSSTFLTGSAELMHYASSKGALIGLTRSLARATGDHGITVNAVSAGRTLTDGVNAWFENGVLDRDETRRSRQVQCIKRLGVPDDVIGAVSFLASDDATFVTGQVINVDGGRNMY